MFTVLTIVKIILKTIFNDFCEREIAPVTVSFIPANPAFGPDS